MTAFVRVLLALGRALVSRVVLTHALQIVKEAARKFVSNDERRLWAVHELMTIGVPESLARLAVEIAVQELKP